MKIRSALSALALVAGAGFGVIGTATAASAAPAPTSTTAEVGAAATKITHAQATSRFSSSGITWSSSGAAPTATCRPVPPSTS